MPRCDECDSTLMSVEQLGGDYCQSCNIWYAPYGYENIEIR